MNRYTTLGLFLGILVLAGAGIYIATSTPCEGGSCDPQKPVTVLEDRAPTQKGVDAAGEGQPTAGTYESYAPEKLARAETGDVVLFFHASWCPSCRFLDANIKAHLKDIPNGLSILKLDYDTEVALKKKYGVTTQHTLVHVDADGNLIKKWSGGATVESIVTQLQ